MNDVYNYIFSNLRRIENREDSILKAMNKYAKNNKKLSVYMIVSAACITIAELRINEHKDQIAFLSRRIDELEKKLEDDKEV